MVKTKKGTGLSPEEVEQIKAAQKNIRLLIRAVKN